MEHCCRRPAADTDRRSTVRLEGFLLQERCSTILPGITEGWPRILSDLKTPAGNGNTLVPA